MCGQMEALQHVVKGATKTGHVQLCAQSGDGLIVGLVAGGDHQLIQPGRSFQSFNLAG
ncbi:hypothetical protein D3C78_1475090 [compost metagenome]